jgi:DNA invertase Pin-like site-specific DNA recombinase
MSARKTTAAAASPAPAAPRKAYSYLRFSTPEQQKGDSTRRQTQKAEEYVQRQQGRLVLDRDLTFHDLGVSAFRGKNAETGALAAFLEAVKVGQVPQGSVLLVESLDRVSRLSARKAVRVLEEILEEGVSVVTLNDGREYTEEILDTDPMALILALLTFIRANEESVTKSGRVRAAWDSKRTKATAGKVRMTSMVPAWLKATADGTEVIPEAAATVRRVFEMYASGKGLVAIQRALNTDGVPTLTPPNGRKATRWHESYISRLLRNPAVVGTFQPTSTSFEGRKRLRRPACEPIPGYFPAIVEEALFQQVQAMLADTAGPSRGKSKGDTKNLFGGLAVCSKCGSSMRRKVAAYKLADGTRKTYSYFACTASMAGAGCSYNAVVYETVEASFLRQAGVLFAQAPTSDDGLEAEVLRAAGAVDALEEHRVKLRDLMLETGLRSLAADLQAAEVELENLKATRDALVAKANASAGPVLDGRLGELGAALGQDALDRAKVNALLRSVLSRVIVDTEAKSGRLVWKHGAESEFVFGVPAAR